MALPSQLDLASASDFPKGLFAGALGKADDDESVGFKNLALMNYVMIGLLGLIVLLLIGIISLTLVKNRRHSGKMYQPVGYPRITKYDS